MLVQRRPVDTHKTQNTMIFAAAGAKKITLEHLLGGRGSKKTKFSALEGLNLVNSETKRLIRDIGENINVREFGKGSGNV